VYDEQSQKHFGLAFGTFLAITFSNKESFLGAKL
jgi:hypothetical protein